VLNGASIEDMNQAKAFFLKFSGESAVDSTRLGQILKRRSGAPGRIYVTGLLVAEEEKFAFSYNITSLTKRMRDALNRERTNVGRTAYADRMKDILLESQSISVASTLADELSKIQSGTNSDEVNWTDVAVHASKILNAKEDVLFVCSTQMLDHPDALDSARSDGMRIVLVPENIIQKIGGLTDVEGNAIRDMQTYQTQYQESFKFKYVEYEDLSSVERVIFDKRHEIIALDGKLPAEIKAIVISETMRPDFSGMDHTQGLWDPFSGKIVIRRDQLRAMDLFAGTLLHEVAHARGGHPDVTRAFEEDLTSALGRVASRSRK
jgi:rRNA-processing protein FCF1